MALLRSIGNSFLNDEVLKALKNNNIFNTLDFLQEDCTRLFTTTKLTFKEIFAIRQQIFEKYSASVVKGSSYHKKLLGSFAILPTCIEKLDEMLQGGLRCGKVTEICSLPDSGKTQLAFTLAANISSELKRSVLYIDTKGDFSATRIHQILSAKCNQDEEMAINLDRIKVINLLNMYDIISFLHKLQHNEELLKSLGLIIVNSLPAVMMQFHGEKTKDSLGLLNHFVNIVRSTGMEFNIPFVTINLLTRWVETASPNENNESDKPEYIVTTKPSLGKYWKHIPYASIHVEKCKDNVSQVKIALKVSNVFVDVKEITLNLTSDGVF